MGIAEVLLEHHSLAPAEINSELLALRVLGETAATVEETEAEERALHDVGELVAIQQ